MSTKSAGDPPENPDTMRVLEQLLRQEYEKGFEMGQREFFLGQLAERFGSLPAAVTQRVARASLQDLKGWGSHLFWAHSFAEVFAPPRPRLTFLELLRQEEFEKGYKEGQREFLLGHLTERFGSLSAAIVSRVDQGSRDELERWIDRLFDAASLDDVFASS